MVYNMDYKEYAQRFIEEDDLEWAIMHSKHFTVREFLMAMKEIDRLHATSRMKQYLYLVTFTVDPKKHSEITPQLEAKIERLLEAQPQRPALKVTKASMVKELHKSGRPHWHMKLLTNKPLRSDAFAQYKKVYGNFDISRSKGTNDLHIDIYMEKEGSIKELKCSPA